MSHLIEFTFHYASTLSIKNDGVGFAYSKFTFHYASTLSNHHWYLFDAAGYNLHSTMLLLYPIRRGLCGRGCASFTFHYASTLSFPAGRSKLHNVYLHSTMLLLYPTLQPHLNKSHCTFTFHYASTLSTGIPCTNRPGIYLHSTMLLLYHYKIRNLDCLCIIYIPLCFYFIRKEPTYWGLTVMFTFHYASTLSKREYKRTFRTGVYIPLCFYFIFLNVWI